MAAIGSHVNKKEQKSRKIKISKNQNSKIVRTTEKKLQKKFERIQRDLRESFGSHRVPC